MKQRLGIGIALLGDPEFLILDEPVNGLDPTGIKEIRDVILRLNHERGITFLISSHLLDELAKIVTTYGIINDGMLIEQISAAELEHQLVVIVAYASLFFALSAILQKTGGAIALCIVLPMVLTVVLNLADTALAEREIVLSRYWLSKLINSVGSITVEKDALKDALLYSAIYIPVSLAAGWLATMKREY